MAMHESHKQVVSLADAIEVDQLPLTNRRSEMRRRPGDVRWLRGARLKYGPEVEIIDVSRSGIRIRSHRELAVNDTVVLELSAATGKFPVIARVLRSRKVTESPSAWFESACRFKRPLETEKYSSPVSR